MANYYTTYRDVQRAEFKKQDDAKTQLMERIKTPIKYDIYPTIVTSDTDKDIEQTLYDNRNMYTNAPLHKGDYTYRGYNCESKYQRLYKKVFDLNKDLWEVPPMELASAYLDLYKEFTLFEQWNDYTYDLHADSGDWGTKARLTARKCGIDMTAGLQIANKMGFFRAYHEYTAGAGVYDKKEDFKRYNEDLQREFNKGKKSFESDTYFAKNIRDQLPCMYTMLNLFCGMYRDIFCYRNRNATESIRSPQMVKASGFDEYKYKQNGGENFELGWLTIAGGVFMALIMSSSPMAVVLFALPVIGIGILNVVLGWNSQ